MITDNENEAENEKNRSSRYIINRPSHRHEHKYKGVHRRRYGHRRPLVF